MYWNYDVYKSVNEKVKAAKSDYNLKSHEVTYLEYVLASFVLLKQFLL